MNCDNSVILSVKELSLEINSKNQKINILRNIFFDLHSKEILAIIGESGSGKTSLAKSILNLHNSDVFKMTGEINYKNTNLILLNNLQLEKIRGKMISFIFQDPHTHLNPLLTVGYQIKETLVKHKISNKKNAKELVMNIFNDVGLRSSSDIYNMYPFQLSGGMKQRIMIAIAICCNPEIIIADEPTTSLDSNIQRTIVELLMKLCMKRSISIIWITHNINLAKYVADNVAIMYDGEIIEYGNKNKIIMNPNHTYTKGLINISNLKNINKDAALKTINDFN